MAPRLRNEFGGVAAAPRVGRGVFLALTTALGLSGPGIADAATLMEALATAYTTNPTLQAERAALRQVNEGVPQALSNWRPQLEAFGQVGQASRNIRGAPDQTLTPREVGVRVIQPLYRGGRTLAATRAAENSVLAGRNRLTAVEQQILFDAVSAYINVLAAEAVLEFEIQNEQRLIRFLEATRDRFEVGEVTRTDVFQAEARLARATADRVRGEGDLAATRATYQQVIGEAPRDLVLPEVPGDLPTTVEEAIQAAVDRNPAVLAAEYDERAFRDTVDEVRGELLPSLELRGEAGRAIEFTNDDSRLDNYEATVNLTVPLYQSGAVYSRLRQAKQAVTESLNALDQSRRDARELATQAWNDLQAASAQVAAFTTEVRANEVAVEGSEREQAVGTRTVLDVLDTQQDLLESQRSLVEARRDELREAFRLKAAVGNLTAAELGLAVDFYDPLNHYENVRGRWFGVSSPGDVTDTEGSESGR